MPKKPKVPAAYPGDLVQIIAADHPLRTLFALVIETHSWGVGVNVPAVQGGQILGRYERFKPAQIVVVGAAALLPAEVQKAREAAMATAALIQQENKDG